MGDVAGSGGYYVACASDIIFADESTITASIGTITQDAGNHGAWTWTDNNTDLPFGAIVTITATDLAGASSSTQFSLTVNDLHPTASAGGPYTTGSSQSITLSGTASSPSGDAIVSYAWDLDHNGTYETVGQNVSFSRAQLGTYTVGLRVTDDDGERDDRLGGGDAAVHGDGAQQQSGDQSHRRGHGGCVRQRDIDAERRGHWQYAKPDAHGQWGRSGGRGDRDHDGHGVEEWDGHVDGIRNQHL